MNRRTPNASRYADNTGQAMASRAFTLIEMILAIGVTAIVLVAINGVFFSALRLRESTVAAVDQALPVQQALTTLRCDLQGAMPPATNGVLSGDFKVGSVSSPGLNQPADIELFTTTGALRENEPWGEIQKITYELKTPADATAPGKDLIRSVTRNLLATITPQPQDQWMIGGVESIAFSCYDGTQWRENWDTTMTDTNLPVAVRVRIQFARNAGGPADPQPVEIIVPIDSQPRTARAIATTTGS
jgi:general secretion pathway protein J